MKLTSFGYLIFISTLIISCSKTDQNSTAQEIDYATLNTLNFTTELEIGESEDFIPGNLNDLIVSADGSILASDYDNISIEQFSSTGKHLGSIATEGRGPGELTNFFSMTDLGNDTILVNLQSGRIMTFAKTVDNTFEFVNSRTPDDSKQRIRVTGEFKDGQYFASEGLVIQDVNRYIKNMDNYRTTVIKLSDISGKIIKDTVALLKTAQPHLKMSAAGGISVNTVPYRYTDRLQSLRNGTYLVAKPDSNYLYLYNERHLIEKRIPLKVIQRKITDTDLEFALRDHSKDIHAEIENRIPQYKPPYTNLWVTENRIWLLSDETEEGKEIVIIDFNGNPLGKFLLPLEDQIKHIESNYFYSVHKSETKGDLIRKYKIEL